RFAVGHVEHAAAIDEHAMRPRELALMRIWLRSVAASAGAEHGRDDAGLEINPAYHMVLGVGDIQPAGRIREALRSAKLRRTGRTSVAGISRLTGSRKVMDRAGLGID